MKEFNELEFDKMCAVFMGYDINRIVDVMPHKKNGDILSTGDLDDNGNRCNLVWVHSLRYHYDWNCLIKVVEKIEDMGYDVFINAGTCMITDVGQGMFENIEFYNKLKINAVRAAVVEFINWYNENK